MYYLLNIYKDYLQLFINKLNISIYVLFILLLGAQPFVIQACEVNFTSGILLKNFKFNYTHLSGHILGSYSPYANL